MKMPHGWEQAELQTVLLKTNYGHTASSSQAQIGPRFLRITDLRSEGVNWETVPYCECDQIDKYALAEGDIVVARTGATTGKSFLIRGQVPDAIFASYLIRLRTSEGYEPEFLQLFMQSPNYWSQIITARTGTAQPGVNATKLGGLEVPVPPLNEQHRIVAKIESLFERSRRAKEALDKIPSLLDKLRQSILAAAFRGDLTADWRAQNPDVEPADKLLARIRTERRQRWEQTELVKLQAKGKGKEPKDDKWKAKYKEPGNLLLDVFTERSIPAVPSSWQVTSLDALTQLATGKTPSTRESMYWDGPIPFVTPSEIHPKGYMLPSKRTVTEAGAAAARLIPPRSTLIVCIGTVGKVGLLEQESITNQQINTLTAQPGYHERLLYYWCQFLRPWVERTASATVNAAILNKGRLARGPCVLPPEQEQENLVQVLDAAFVRLDRIEARIHEAVSLLKGNNTSILAKAFRGELVPQDPNDEPASVLLDRIRAAREAAKPAKKTRTKRRVDGKKNTII